MPRDTQFPKQSRTQADRVKRVFAGFVVTAVEEAAEDEKRDGSGGTAIVEWAQSREGREILIKAGINPGEKCVDTLHRLVLDRAAEGKSWSGREIVVKLKTSTE
ncbi:DUF6280 family protein [Pseudaestuariivita atlantica]|uniref:Uncharacterized protein n=1 Tax=Pseudaestuariivita atlantica TaxID=1317121 RepID=A0A0L1JVK1_9RHOB|nr:DUF6280 family protein [Pseudaestuariivita atlantica]KNG95418.1 hypothetical protein ATO11_02095 [Pseudaestuariivita atlantica]